MAGEIEGNGWTGFRFSNLGPDRRDRNSERPESGNVLNTDKEQTSRISKCWEGAVEIEDL